MHSIPHDPVLLALQDLFPTVGVPGVVAQMAQEVAGPIAEGDIAGVSYVRYRPTRNCHVLWSFQRQSGQPLLVSGQLSGSARGGATAQPSFQRSVELASRAIGGRVCPYRYLPDRQLQLQVFPLDIRLPGLALAASSSWARKAFSRSLGALDSELSVAQPISVAYKPWRRCVLRYVVEVRGRPIRYFAKVFRDDRGAVMVERLCALRTQLLSSDACWDIVAPLTYFPDACMLVLPALEKSEELSPLLRKAAGDSDARGRLLEHFSRLAEGLFVFQHMHIDGLPYVAPRDFLTEYARDLDGILHVAPSLAKAVQGRLRSLEAAAALLPAEEIVLSHGAFRYNQFLSCGNTLVALDLDALCLSGCGADAGEFLAYLDVTALRRPHLRAVISDCEQVFRESVLKHCRGDSRWLAWYRAVSHVKWAQRIFLSLDARWPELTQSLLQLAEQSLARLAA